MLTPDPASRLSDGVVIETRLRARLFGAPVLKLDGTVLVSPARVDLPEGHDVVAAARGAAATSVRAAPELAARAEGAPGAALAQATRLLEQSRASLEGRG